MELNGKRVAITGASSGIGHEILELLLVNGCRVAACARHIENIGIENSKHIFPSTMFRITNAVSRVFPFVFTIYVNINNHAFQKWLTEGEQ